MHFPARLNHPGVFAIFAATGDGSSLPSNPPLAHDNYFCILGKGVRSTWPNGLTAKVKKTQLTEQDQHDGWKCMSGTSVATPVAAALFAVLLQYQSLNLDNMVVDDENPISLLKRPAVVRSIFRKMVDTNGNCNNIIPWWADFHPRNKGNTRDLSSHLKDIAKMTSQGWYY
jgi:hypothetical protein